jgi:hypothetical protein
MVCEKCGLEWTPPPGDCPRCTRAVDVITPTDSPSDTSVYRPITLYSQDADQEMETATWSIRNGIAMIAIKSILFIAWIVVIIMWLFRGDTWYINDFSHWYVKAICRIIIPYVLGILVILSLIRQTRGIAAIGLSITSWLYGSCWCVISLAFVIAIWGKTLAIIGVIIMGLGEIPLALIALLLNKAWSALGEYAAFGAISIVLFIVGNLLALNADKYRVH